MEEKYRAEEQHGKQNVHSILKFSCIGNYTNCKWNKYSPVTLLFLSLSLSKFFKSLDFEGCFQLLTHVNELLPSKLTLYYLDYFWQNDQCILCCIVK